MSIRYLVAEDTASQIRAVSEGLPPSAVAEAAEAAGLSEGELLAGLSLPRRTLAARRRAGRRLPPPDSERLLRVARVEHLLSPLGAGPAAIGRWLTEPHPLLAGQVPLELLRTDLGARQVERLAAATVHGVPF